MKPFWRLSGVFIAVSFMMLLIVMGVQAGAVFFWPASGVPISVMPYGQSNAHAVSDGNQGAIIVWEDFRSGVNRDIYAQSVNSSGQVRWAANGVSVSTASNDQSSPGLAGDGFGGAIITWQDKRNGSDNNIFAQRIASNGLTLWTTNGIAVRSELDTQEVPQITSDDRGGAIIVWQDYRSGNQWDVYAQRLAPDGHSLWASGGITVGL